MNLRFLSNYLILIFFLSTSLIAQEKSLTGKIISLEDTGLGPFEGMTIEDNNTGEFYYFMVEMGLYNKKASDGILVGKTVEVKFNTTVEQTITDMMFESEFEKSPTQAHVYISGIFKGGEIGDMGSYITIMKSDGEQYTYKGDFEIDVSNNDKYLNKPVILYYSEDEVNQLIGLNVIDSKHLSINGKVIDVLETYASGAFFLIVENENEIVELIIFENILQNSQTITKLKGKMVSINYSQTIERVIISYAFETPTLQEYKTSNDAILIYENKEKFTDIGRYANMKSEEGYIYLEIETASGIIFENVFVYPELGLSDQAKYQDEEFTFTYAEDYMNEVISINILN